MVGRKDPSTIIDITVRGEKKYPCAIINFEVKDKMRSLNLDKLGNINIKKDYNIMR